MVNILTNLEKNEKIKYVMMSTMGSIWLDGTTFKGQGVESITGLAVKSSTGPILSINIKPMS